MRRTVSRIALLALIARACAAAIVTGSPNRKRIDRFYDATLDIMTRCHIQGDRAVGVLGDADLFVQRLWKRHFIPAVLIDATLEIRTKVTNNNRCKLRTFVVIAATPGRFLELMNKLMRSVWSNHNANFIVVSPTPDESLSLSAIGSIFMIAYNVFGVLNAQVIQSYRNLRTAVFDFNPYTDKSPDSWYLLVTFPGPPRPFHIFIQPYLKNGEPRTCASLTFGKTSDIGGYPLDFMVSSPWVHCRLTDTCTGSPLEGEPGVAEIDELLIGRYRWFVDTLATAMNATAVIKHGGHRMDWDISLIPGLYSDYTLDLHTDEFVHSFTQAPLFAMTQHTPHMSQLQKILSVIDRTSRIGMYVVYLITFLFFKLFMGQSVVPAVLNLVRLTCNTGMANLPTNVAPTLYLATLFMFVITMQAIYTGNLASLLTTTIAYPHVDTKESIPKLGYTVYAYDFVYNKIAADPVLDGLVVKIHRNDLCDRYVLDDPLAACVGVYYELVTQATKLNLHLSREPIQHDYEYHWLTSNNPLGRRVQDVVVAWHECGLRRLDDAYLELQAELVDDDDVRRNTVRRIMNVTDLRFAFVILGIGLAVATGCFLMEILVHRAKSRLAERRDGVRAVAASAPPAGGARRLFAAFRY